MKSKLAVALVASLMLAPGASLAQTRSPENFITVQPADQWMASLFIGQAVTNAAGETIGNINDLLFDKSGRISGVVIGVGGFLGIGEKMVAVPYTSLSITADGSGKRVVQAPLSRESLNTAPDFKPHEKTTYMRAKEQATDMGQKAIDKAKDLKDQAARKIEEMRKESQK